MTTIIAAPAPLTRVTCVLPSAKFEDSHALSNKVDVKRSMLGRVITYVKSSPNRTLKLPFELTRAKALELQAFITIYYRAEWIITLHDNTMWRGRLLSNPFESVDAQRSMVQVTLELNVSPYFPLLF